MHIPARVDYGIRALLALMEVEDGASTEALAAAQDLPTKFLGSILNELRRADILTSQRGFAGGYRLARPASAVTLADVMRVLDGPLAEVRGRRPEYAVYRGAAVNLQTIWVALRASIRGVLEEVTLEDVHLGRFPATVEALSRLPDSWQSRVTDPRPAHTG